MTQQDSASTQQVIKDIYGSMQDGLIYEDVTERKEHQEIQREVQHEDYTASQFVRDVLANNVSIVTPKRKIIMTPELHRRVC